MWQCKKNSGFWVEYFLRYLSLKTVLNFTVAILELIWSQNPQIKMAVSQKLFKIQISNFRFFLLSGRWTIGMKIKKFGDQSAWAIRWNDMEWPVVKFKVTTASSEGNHHSASTKTVLFSPVAPCLWGTEFSQTVLGFWGWLCHWSTTSYHLGCQQYLGSYL